MPPKPEPKPMGKPEPKPMGRPPALDRKKHAACRKLVHTHHFTPEQISSVYNWKENSIARAAGNTYAAQDNVDSDDERLPSYYEAMLKTLKSKFPATSASAAPAQDPVVAFLAGCQPPMPELKAALNNAGVVSYQQLRGMAHWNTKRLTRFLYEEEIARTALEKESLLIGFEVLMWKDPDFLVDDD
ncbi:hypothetical protein FB45DRAFT_1037060 [Roridomyces roridus]|uniref:Uncharacterized protein n=1 Tax=Roridomyces roridus TaxID=1738132 RepID=A0AAD7FAE2_9AGAR|nr:hypothetical protein FB45DRAFT_1037060 [Roridomyces roridus]